ncbi:MAG TPA: RidA family protein [Chloroflexota bacterium]|jgi:enamine deaminase RidA (YjgF/YER057c/UK114 family)|nr:RidA family protein [Chloroflexota bacterium]
MAELPEWTNPPGVYAPQAHYSQVGKVGNTLYISGQLGLDVNGELVGAGDAQAQARQAWQNLIGILAHYGATVRNLVKTNTYITHWAYRPLVGAARDELFSGPPYPPSTLVIVQGLSEPRFLVEIEAIAIVD